MKYFNKILVPFLLSKNSCKYLYFAKPNPNFCSRTTIERLRPFVALTGADPGRACTYLWTAWKAFRLCIRKSIRGFHNSPFYLCSLQAREGGKRGEPPLFLASTLVKFMAREKCIGKNRQSYHTRKNEPSRLSKRQNARSRSTILKSLQSLLSCNNTTIAG